MADFAKDLTFGAVVFVEINLWRIASWAFAVVGNVALGSSLNRLYGLVGIIITPFQILHEVMVVPGFNMKDQREFINLKLLIFRGLGVIKSPLFQRYVFADKA